MMANFTTPILTVFLVVILTSSAIPADASSSFRLRPAIHDNSAGEARRSARLDPISAASGDLDGDGMPDLVCGFAGPGENAVALYRGNVDSIFPHRPEARARRATGAGFDEPFHAATTFRSVPVRPDFLATGDFDGDGPWDVVLASCEGTALYLLPGDGMGGFADAVAFPVEGPITALVAGEVNRADGIVDLVVGVHGASGPAVLVLEGPEGALRRGPDRLMLPAPADELALGRVMGGWLQDLIVASGEELLVFEGRDRRLASTTARQAAVPPPAVTRVGLDERASAIAVDDFVSDDRFRPEIAVLSRDGLLTVFGRDAAELETAGSSEAPIVELSRTVVGAPQSLVAGALHAARLSRGPGADLVVLDGVRQSMQVLSRDASSEAWAAEAVTDLQAAPLAVLPMRLNQDARTDFVVLEAGGGIAVAETTFAATITVDSTADAAIAGNGECTLREAILNANDDNDTTGGDCEAGVGDDLIEFQIGGGGAAATIESLTAWLRVAEPVTINGNTQGCPDPPCIEIVGSAPPLGSDGLYLYSAGNSVVRGLAINRFAGGGVVVELSSKYHFEGNYIGTDRSGSNAEPNARGISFLWATGTIGGTVEAARNVISGNTSSGISLQNTGGSGLIQGNYIGVDATGSSAVDLGNGGGIRLADANHKIVGGTIPGARNVISGGGTGVEITALEFGSVLGNIVQGNYIGTDATGTVARGNGWGVYLNKWVDGATVGGTIAAARNIISGNGQEGILARTRIRDGVIAGNYIGTDVTGTAALGNGHDGIKFYLTENVDVGGIVPGARNVISGNGQHGFELGPDLGHDTRILGNYIGTDVTGLAALPNQWGGVRNEFEPGTLVGGTVGGMDPGAGNLISGNIGIGVESLGVPGATQFIQGNLIGTDATGVAPLGNTSHGVRIESMAQLGGASPEARNVISGNGASGVFLEWGSTNQVQGNYIGLDATGASAMPNGGYGVKVRWSSNNLIGGADPGAGNVIATNAFGGVSVEGQQSQSAFTNRIEGNLIGTDVTGTVDMATGVLGGVQTGPYAVNTKIGGTLQGAGNLISGYGTFGVLLGGVADRLEGNYIGTDISGMAVLGNGLGVQAGSGAQIGGTAAGAGNLISGSASYAILANSDNVVQGNLIGTDASGSGVLGNGWGLWLSGSDNTIGGTSAGAANTIVGSDGDAISVIGVGNAIRSNSVHDNALLGIDLDSDGVTPNDMQDPDGGPNNKQNFPELGSVNATPASVTIDATLNSTPGSLFDVEFFSSSACDAMGQGEGDRYLGVLKNVPTDGNGDAVFNAVFTVGAADGEAITATATDANGNTSEYSPCAAVACTLSLPFTQTLQALDAEQLIWFAQSNVRFVKGDLADVGSYPASGSGWKLSATSLDISFDRPEPGAGLYYLVRSLACGSWQTTAGAEPGRDLELP